MLEPFWLFKRSLISGSIHSISWTNRFAGDVCGSRQLELEP
jgi:hypothetical protein